MALSCGAVQAGPIVLTTEARPFPTPAARWDFAREPFSLAQITEVDAGYRFLSGPASVSFRDGKTAEPMTPATETVDIAGGTMTVHQQFTTSPLEVEQRLSVRDGTLVWEISLSNDLSEDLWIEPTLRLPFRASNQARYWDGGEGHAFADAPFTREEVFNTFPVSLFSDGDHGVAVGVPPRMNTSCLRNGIDGEGRAFYGTRLVVTRGQPCGITFLVYLVKQSFGERDAVRGYYRRFPGSFEPAAGVDPRLVDGRRTDSLQICHYGGGLATAARAVEASEYYSGYEWGYAPFKRPGDYVGRQEYWEMDLTEGEQRRLDETAQRGTWDRTDWERFHQTRQDLFRNADLRGNICLAFYIVNNIDKALAEQWGIVEYAFPRTETKGLIEKNWVLPYDTLYYFYPWATPYEDVLRRDLPEVVDELNVYAFAHDLYGEKPGQDTRYRKKLDYYLPGWSYDEEGPYISRSLGFRHDTDFIHTLKKDGRTMGLIVNGMSGADPLCFFAPDAYISEARMTAQLESEERNTYIHCRMFAGHKPVYQHGYASGILLGDIVPWETLTPEQCRAVYDDFVRDYLIYLYQAGLTPSRQMSSVHGVISQELPVLLEVMGRGYEPAPACIGNPALERVRYGPGLGAAVVLSNRSRAAVTSEERLVSDYIEAGSVMLPMEGRGGELSCSFNGGQTTFPLTVEPMGNRIITCPVAVSSDASLKGSAECVSQMRPTRRTYRIDLDLAAPAAARIRVAPDPGFTVAGMRCGGQPVSGDGTVQLAAGSNSIVVETLSTRGAAIWR